MNSIKSLLVLIGILYCHAIHSQSKGDLKMTLIDLSGSFYGYNSSNGGSCGSTSFEAKANTVVELVSKTGDRWVVKIRRAYVGTNQVQRGGTPYCISESDLNSYCMDFSFSDFGILDVPFKGRLSPFKILPGGTLGGYYGRKFINQHSKASTLMAFGGISSIPLNDINSDVIDTQLGFTIGGGYVWYIANGFQIGLIGGWDFFDGVNTWAYKYQPWVSFNIGYGFTSNAKQRQQQLASLLPAK